MESIIFSCMESKSDSMVDHVLHECDLIGKILQTDKNPMLSEESNKVDMISSHCFLFKHCNVKCVVPCSFELIIAEKRREKEIYCLLLLVLLITFLHSKYYHVILL